MWVKLPSSVAIPFGSFEAVLQDEINADVSVEFVKLAGFGGAAEEDLSNLASLQAAVQRLRAPEQLKLQLRDAFGEEGAVLHCMLRAMSGESHGRICNELMFAQLAR